MAYDYFGRHYLRERMCPPADVAFVFGRADTTLADVAASLHEQGIVPSILVTGGIGKDSGPLPELVLSEAKFLTAYLAVNHRVPLKDILIEEQAENGGQNARLGLALLMERGLSLRDIVLVGHATSLYRLALTFKHEAGKLGIHPRLHLVAPDHTFLKGDELLQLKELIKVADGPEKGWTAPAEDLPRDLVNEVRAFLAANTPA